MKRILITLCVIGFVCPLCNRVNAQRSSMTNVQDKRLEKVYNNPVQHKYRFDDNLFFDGSIGATLSLSEDVLKENVVSMLRPKFEINIGKMLNKWCAARVGLGLSFIESSLPEQDGSFLYNMCMMGLQTDAMICLNRLFVRYRHDEAFRLWGYGGIDGFRSIFYQKMDGHAVDCDSKWGVGWHTGIESQFSISEHTYMTVAAQWNETAKNHNGQKHESKGAKTHLSLNVGFVYNFINSHGEIGFHDCRHNENYYFDEKDRQLEEYYRSRHSQCLNEVDTILVYPYHYSYLTELQQKKLDRLMRRMIKEKGMKVQIDVYSDGDESQVYNEFRAENREEQIIKYIRKKRPELIDRITINRHAEASPIPSEHIWSRAGIIKII